jgi:hypothetical protein
MTSNTHSVVYMDGRVDHPAAPNVRQSIALQERKIGEIFSRGNFELAARFARELNEYKLLNSKYLVPTWPAVR